VKLGKNASDRCEMLSVAYGGEDVNESSVLDGINGSKRVARTWKMMKVGRQSPHGTDENVKKVRNLVR
jgi:hypothetical protein